MRDAIKLVRPKRGTLLDWLASLAILGVLFYFGYRR